MLIPLTPPVITRAIVLNGLLGSVCKIDYMLVE
jgi:hypothetical protein